ncbi:hypothetical protein FNV43_RR01455 [Rhamnella rubrinervis]|uniref:Uncharacterized protein n=1 Tax=Rhamnella rubrinervis TaxID=2594499 RepID=A0A8K0MS20_9ROSA|nr:hypothetical protein FNV43_RR01455 [Rhamnella rubrinervis]
MLAGIRNFNEHDIVERRKLYARDRTRRVRFNSNHDLFRSQRADWRDTLSIVSNGKFKSNLNRVVPSREARVSAICCFAGRVAQPARFYGPIKELINEENPAKYRQVLVSEYVGRFYTKGLDEKPSLNYYRL